jgi:protein-tyrosine phosphatase
VGPIDLHFIAPDLAVGAAFSTDAAARLARDHGISRVVDVRREACDDPHALRTHGITLLHLPTSDTCAVSQPMLREGVAFINGGREGERTFVHCQYGIGRSALVALCALVARGEAPLEALEAMKRRRAVISPSPEQLEAFATFAGEWRGAHAASWPVPDFEALAAIAYRHLRGEPTRGEARASSTHDGRRASTHGGPQASTHG